MEIANINNALAVADKRYMDWDELWSLVRLSDMTESENAFAMTLNVKGGGGAGAGKSTMLDNTVVAVEHDVLTVSGAESHTEKKTAKESGGWTSTSKSWQSFSRSTRLPRQVDASKISATRDGDALRITLPKVTASGKSATATATATTDGSSGARRVIPIERRAIA